MKSQAKFIEAIKKEIERVNKAIDGRIIKGLPYIEQAKKHKQLNDLLNQYE